MSLKLSNKCLSVFLCGIKLQTVLWKFAQCITECPMHRNWVRLLSKANSLFVFPAIGLESCPEPQTPNYGIKLGDRYMVGDVVQFQCEQGYSLQVRQVEISYWVYFLVQKSFLWMRFWMLFDVALCVAIGECLHNLHARPCEKMELPRATLPW